MNLQGRKHADVCYDITLPLGLALDTCIQCNSVLERVTENVICWLCIICTTDVSSKSQENKRGSTCRVSWCGCLLNLPQAEESELQEYEKYHRHHCADLHRAQVNLKKPLEEQHQRQQKNHFPKQMCTWKRIRTTANQHHCWSGCLKSFPFSWCFAPWLQLSHRQKAARSRSSAAATHSSSAAANGPFLCYKWHTRAVCQQHALCSQQSQAKAPCWLPPLFSLRLIPAVLICMTGDNHYLHYACHLSFPIYSISIIKNTLLSYKNRGVGGDKH